MDNGEFQTSLLIIIVHPILITEHLADWIVNKNVSDIVSYDFVFSYLFSQFVYVLMVSFDISIGQDY